jgi:membrane protease YdiL (CAAX protease family)
MIQLCFTWFRGERLKNAVKEFFRKYRDILLLNKSIAVSGIISFVIGMIFTESYAGFAGPESSIENSIYTLAVGYASYLPIFVYLFYRDNKDRYVDPNSSTINSHKLIRDIRKLFAAFSVSEAVFIVTKTYIHFHLLELGYLEPYQAYFVAELIAWIVYFVSMNSILKAVKMYRVGGNSRRLSDPN